MPTEQEAKPAVVTPLQQWRIYRPSEERRGRPFIGLKSPVDERNQRHSKFYQMVQLYRRYEARELVDRFERLPNVVPVASLTDETDLVSLIRTIAVFDNSRNRRRNLTTLALKNHADQTLLAVLRQVPREADPQYVVTVPRRHIADPVSRQAVGARKTKESDLPRSHDVILGWDFLEASQAVIDCGQNELVQKTSVETPQRLTPGICMPPGTIHLSRIL
ncbi:hypothetical protein TNCV_1017481 [Trichonephila clavipes]|uniref:Uncharacterized protein n=1 Tax=Trichonephila clavipes TaxID=2585209 RepID=A0A8X6VYE7_TRICX|nr:hypothetical protein TNCV_1017481 [Trichonephila clavipes]